MHNAIILLPIKTVKRYRGQYPNRINRVSYSSKSFDIEGRPCVHIKTNDGKRYTVTKQNILGEPLMGKELESVCKVISTSEMTQAEYDVWLASVRAGTAPKQFKIGDMLPVKGIDRIIAYLGSRGYVLNYRALDLIDCQIGEHEITVNVSGLVTSTKIRSM